MDVLEIMNDITLYKESFICIEVYHYIHKYYKFNKLLNLI